MVARIACQADFVQRNKTYVTKFSYVINTLTVSPGTGLALCSLPQPDSGWWPPRALTKSLPQPC